MRTIRIAPSIGAMLLLFMCLAQAPVIASAPDAGSSAAESASTLTYVSPGSYDDTGAAWSYAGVWLSSSVPSAYHGTLHVSATLGSTASFGYIGTGFVLTYVRNPNWGKIGVYLDGSRTPITILNSNGTAALPTYTSPRLMPGKHTVTFRHEGPAGARIGVDVIIVTRATQYFVDGGKGSDANPGGPVRPWRSIQKAVRTVVAGDKVFVRAGQYDGIHGGWIFQHSGSQSQPITLTNYPGEQVIFKITNATRNDYDLFVCSINPHNPPTWQTPKADYIRIIGTDVTPRLLSDGVVSKKGIVMQGLPGEQSKAIGASDCDYWEVAGVDFIETSYGIFTQKNNWGMMEEHSTDHWYVHDNRVYNFYRESGMQFNGNYNRIENNQIYKVSNRLDTPYGCQMLNLLGNNNIVKGNTLSRLGSKADCAGLLFEWDLADANLVEQNLIYDVASGINFQGGDNNIVRNNIIYRTGTPEPDRAGMEIYSYNSLKRDWPCNELDPNSTAQAIVPPNDPAHPDFQYFYNPRNCHSYGNQIYNNVVHGFAEGLLLYPLVGENTIIRNNVFSGWSHGSICFYRSSDGSCQPLPADLIADHNADRGNFGFVDPARHNFHLTVTSSLIDAGYDLGSLNPDDYDGSARPRGAGYDIGAFEFLKP